MPTHQEIVDGKRAERDERIAALGPSYKEPLTVLEQKIVTEDSPTIAEFIRKGEWTSPQVLKAFSKAALAAHAKTNCLTEIAIKDGEKWAAKADVSKPLAGLPVSLKDTNCIPGYDATSGYAALAFKPQPVSPVVQLLLDAGAVPFVKTNVPKTMWAIHSTNSVFGTTTNPYNDKYTPGGSSSGEGALLALGGSRFSIGSDIAGSVRIPAHFCGIYSLRMSFSRFPKFNHGFLGAAFEGVPAVNSPMARSIADLKFFTQGVMSMKPWEYDYSLLRMPWRTDASLPEKPKVGVLRAPDLCQVTPPVERALAATENALRAKGLTLVDFPLPEPGEKYQKNMLDLFSYDGFFRCSSPLMKGEPNDKVLAWCRSYLKLPVFIRRVYEWFQRVILGRVEYATALRTITPSPVTEYANAVATREAIRARFFEAWKKSGIDFLITYPHGSPAFPLDYGPSTFTLQWTTLFNILDYPAGVLPVTNVDDTIDMPIALDPEEASESTKALFKTYDPTAMHGLPVGVQVVTLKHEDEEALLAMELVDNALKEKDVAFKPAAP